MPLTLHPCTPSDLPQAVLTERAAFASDPFSPILFPGPFPEGTSEFRVQELAKQMTEDPTTRWVMVVVDGDDSDGTSERQTASVEEGLQTQRTVRRGIAFAKYNLYLEGRPRAGEEGQRSFGEGCNVEACERVFGGLAETRERMLGGRRCLCELFWSCLLFCSFLLFLDLEWFGVSEVALMTCHDELVRHERTRLTD